MAFNHQMQKAGTIVRPAGSNSFTPLLLWCQWQLKKASLLPSFVNVSKSQSSQDVIDEMVLNI